MRTVNRSRLVSSITALLIASPLMASDDNWMGDTKDAWLDGKVEMSLMLNDQLNGSAIDTDINQGVVILSGTVTSQAYRQLAEQVALGVSGISRVSNHIVVEEGQESRHSGTPDSGDANKSVSGHKRVSSKQYEQRAMVMDEQAVSHNAEVDPGVSNSTKNSLMAMSLEDKLSADKKLAGALIFTQVEGAKAILRGHVKDNNQKFHAEHIAKTMKGINAVENNLVIEKMAG